MSESQLFLLTGSNLGNTAMHLAKTEKHISNRIGSIQKKSSIYQSPPWGFSAEQDFLNQVLICTTILKPLQVLEEILAIEKLMGRERNESAQYSSRIIDIDILFFGNEVIQLKDLQIPHPRLHVRKFTLLPLAEIAGNFIHPTLNKRITDLLESCEDSGEVLLNQLA